MKTVSSDRVNHYAMCLIAFSFSFPKYLFPLGIVLLTISSLFIRIKERNIKVEKALVIFYISIFFYIGLRILGNEDLRYGLRVLERNLPFLLVPLLIIPNKLKRSEDFYKSFVLGISIAGTIAMIGVAYEQFIDVGNDSGWYFSSIENYGFHSTYMAMYALIGIVMLSEKKLFSPIISLLLIFLLSAFVIFSSSRIALLALVFLFIIKAVTCGKKFFFFGLALLVGMLILVFSFSEDLRFKINQLKDFQGFSHYDNNNYGSVSVRVAKIKASTLLWKENKWIGKGTGDYREAMVEKYRSKDLECWLCARERYNSHNQYLNTLAAHGIIGFSIFAIWLAYLLVKAWETRNTLLFGVILVFMIISLTESILEVQRGIVVVVFLLYFLPITKRIEDDN